MIPNFYNRRSHSAGRMALALLSTTLVSLAGHLGIETKALAAETADPSAPTSITEPAIALERYRYGDLFSIAFPADWQVTRQEGEPQVVAFTDAEASADSPLRTEVTWIASPPQQVVSQALQEIQAQGYAVALYDAIAMDGTSAIRLWLTDLPDEAAPQAFVSYVGYANGTAKIITYYRDRSPDLDNLLSTIHQSFQRIVEVAPEPPSDEATPDEPSEL